MPSVPTGYDELDTALGVGQPFKGTSVTIQVPWVDREADDFRASVKDFEASSGIDVVVDSAGPSHVAVLNSRIENGDSTLELAMVDQPTTAVGYGQAGKLADVASFMDRNKLQAEHPTTLPLVTDGDHLWGIPYKVDTKSLVWYPVKAFAARGYKVPTTWDALLALSDQIVNDGSHPWCIGMGAGPATGWQATDWLEDIFLRTAGSEKYQQWITHQLKFDSPEVKTAMADMARIFFSQGYVDGGGPAIVDTEQTTAMDPMFNNDMRTPGCWMQKAPAWFGPDFFPDVRANPGSTSKYAIGDDVGLFYFPPIDPAQGTPALGWGFTLIAIQPSDGSQLAGEVKAVAEFLSMPQGIERWIDDGTAISANGTTPMTWYDAFYKQKVEADIVAHATAFAYDASDEMPAVVGGGAEWNELSDWIQSNGATPVGDVLDAIDAAWPTP